MIIDALDRSTTTARFNVASVAAIFILKTQHFAKFKPHILLFYSTLEIEKLLVILPVSTKLPSIVTCRGVPLGLSYQLRRRF